MEFLKKLVSTNIAKMGIVCFVLAIIFFLSGSVIYGFGGNWLVYGTGIIFWLCGAVSIIFFFITLGIVIDET